MNNKVFLILYIFCFYVVVPSVLIISTIKAPFVFEIKVILFCVYVFFALFVIAIKIQLEKIIKHLVEIQLYTRTNFIANETKRLSPDSSKSAMDIMVGDLEEERESNEFKALLGQNWLSLTMDQYSIPIYLVLLGGMVFLVFRYWDKLAF